MADVFSVKKRSQVMSAIKSKGNKDTELVLVAILKRFGITGWRRHWPILGRPDFVFPKRRVALFVDGCFWHGCPKHGRVPSSNTRYWKLKISNNKVRDKEVTKSLKLDGWRVMRIWEHELKHAARVAARIEGMFCSRQ